MSATETRAPGFVSERIAVGPVLVQRIAVGNASGAIVRGRFTIERLTDGRYRIEGSPAFTIERDGAIESAPITGERTLKPEASALVDAALTTEERSALVGALATIAADPSPVLVAEVTLPGVAAVAPDAVLAALAAYREARKPA